MPVIRTLIIFAIAFSLVSLPSVLTSSVFLPKIPVVRAQQETSAGSWYPAGAQEQTLSISQGDGAVSGLPAADPCRWDTKYAESSTTNCVVGAPVGSAYNCSFSAACPTGTPTGTTSFAWQAPIGSPDFCAAAQHFITAFADANITGVTTNANCELVALPVGWPSAVTAINTSGNCVSAGIAANANTCAFVRTTEPRKSLGEGITQDICALFSPAWGAWTTLAGQPFSCDNSNTGTGNAACGGGSCPFLQEVEGSIGQFCGFNPPPQGVPNKCWGFGTFGFGQVFPFDSTLYFEYNSNFASYISGSPCTGTTRFP